MTADRIHEERLQRIEREQARAAQMLDVFRRQVRLLREAVGLPRDPVLEADPLEEGPSWTANR